MTHSHENNNNTDRLSRIEALVESNSRAIQALIEQRGADQLQHDQAMAEIRAVTRSNARSIQALMEQQATDRLRHEEVISQIRELNANHDQRINLLENVSSRLTEVQLSMARMLSNIDQNQPTILSRLTNIENKVDQLLDQNQE